MNTVKFQRPDEKKLQIEIFRYKSDQQKRKKIEDHHRHDFHSIFYVQKGQCVQEVDFIEYTIQPNQVLLIPKGATHWEKQEDGVEGYIILFTDELFSTLQRELLNGFLQYAIALRKIVLEVPTNSQDTFHHYFQLLATEQEAATNQNQIFILQNLMLALLNKLEGLIQYLPEHNSFINTRIPFQKFISLVEENYFRQKTLDFYTAHLNITQRKLNAILKEVTGQTASHFIIDRIIVEAKRELSFSEKSIKEIAYDLGYDNQYYFSKIFKKRTQLSPEQFRAQFAQ